jgi:predicted AAA+ superfamily ATPase
LQICHHDPIFTWLIHRRLTSTLLARLDTMPAVGLLGPRQSGKTTLALSVGVPRDAVYLDLESESDQGKLAEPEAYLSAHLDRLVILDEVHRAPGLFPILRGLIDRSRRAGRKAGQYLLLGFASLDLLRQSGETLAGRIAYLELSPLDALEARSRPLDDLWLRGGFPESLLARDDADSLHWRQDFIRTCLERDIPQFGPRLPAETLRRLPPWHANLGKRLVKAPRIFVRDSGLVHALTGVPDRETLLSHPRAELGRHGHREPDRRRPGPGRALFFPHRRRSGNRSAAGLAGR